MIYPRTSRSFCAGHRCTGSAGFCGSLFPHSMGKRNASGIQMMVKSSTGSRRLASDSGIPPFSYHPPRETQRSIMGNYDSLQRQLQLSVRLLIWSIFNFCHFPREGLPKRKENGKIYLQCREDMGRGWLDIWIPTTGSLDDKPAQSVLSLHNLSWAAHLTRLGHNVCMHLYLNAMCKRTFEFILAFCVRPLFISQGLHNHTFVFSFFRCTHNMTAHYQGENKRHVSKLGRCETTLPYMQNKIHSTHKIKISLYALIHNAQ